MARRSLLNSPWSVSPGARTRAPAWLAALLFALAPPAWSQTAVPSASASIAAPSAGPSRQDAQAEAELRAPAPCAGALPPGPIGIDQVLAQALCADPRTRQTWTLWRAQQAQLGLERRLGEPSLQASLDGGRSTTRLTEEGVETRGRGPTHALDLEATWVLLDFGQRRAAVETERQTLAAAAAHHDRSLQLVALEAAESFYRLRAAQATLDALTESERFIRDTLNVALRSEGRREAIDALEERQVRSALAQRRLERIQAEGQLVQAQGELAVRLGLPPGRAVVATAEPEPPTDGLELRRNDAEVDALIDQALRQHPELLEARARLGAARSQWEGAQRQDRPTVSAVAGHRRSRDVFDARSREEAIGLRIEIPLSGWRQGALRERQARYQMEALGHELQSLQRQTALEVWAAHQEQKAQMQSLQASHHAWTEARELLQAEAQAFRRGDGDLFDLIDASQAVLDAVRETALSAGALRYQRLRLAAGIGRLQLTPLE